MSLTAVALCAALCLSLSVAIGAGSVAQPVVEQLQSALLEALKQGDKSDFAARYARLAPVVTETHDFDTIARLVIGRKHWGEWQAGQREAFLATFRELSIATYADKFSSWSGERFEVLGEEETQRGNELVRTTLTKSNGDRVQLDYVLMASDGQWRIINVIADGVSDLALKRSEYTQVLDDQGYDALIGKLREKIEQAAN
jgi:phospholipid transport system substrate-binding protein